MAIAKGSNAARIIVVRYFSGSVVAGWTDAGYARVAGDVEDSWIR